MEALSIRWTSVRADGWVTPYHWVCDTRETKWQSHRHHISVRKQSYQEHGEMNAMSACNSSPTKPREGDPWHIRSVAEHHNKNPWTASRGDMYEYAFVSWWWKASRHKRENQICHEDELWNVKLVIHPLITHTVAAAFDVLSCAGKRQRKIERALFEVANFKKNNFIYCETKLCCISMHK